MRRSIHQAGSLDTHPAHRPGVQVEPLESRQLMAADLAVLEARLNSSRTEVFIRTSVQATTPSEVFGATEIGLYDSTSATFVFGATNPGSTGLIFGQAGTGNGEYTHLFDQPKFDDNGNQIGRIKFSVAPGHVLMVVIDPFGRCAETNESNNVLIVDTGVAPPPAPENIQLATPRFNGDLSHIKFFYRVTPDTLSGNFDVGLYRSADAKFDTGDTLVKTQTVAAPGTVVLQEGTFTLASPLIADPNLPYLLVVADPSNARDESNEKDNVAGLVLPTVTAKISGAFISTDVQLATLLNPVKIAPQLNVKPKGGTITSNTIEVRRQGTTTWQVVQTNAGKEKTLMEQKLAGHFEFRARVTINGVEFVTPAGQEAKLTVQFPGIREIMATKQLFFSGGITSFKKAAATTWVLNIAQQQGSTSERDQDCFWIQLDTSLPKYELVRAADVVTANDKPDPFLNAGTRPADVIAADGKSAKYTVGLWRRHSLYEFVESQVGSRTAGPSVQEIEDGSVFEDNVPQFILDYVGYRLDQFLVIDPGWPAKAKWKIWPVPVAGLDTAYDRRQLV